MQYSINIPLSKSLFNINFKHIAHFNMVDGGVTYLVNCTSDREICDEHDIQGFPMLVAFRGLGWLEGSQCVSSQAIQANKLIRLDYYGVLTVSVF